MLGLRRRREDIVEQARPSRLRTLAATVPISVNAALTARRSASVPARRGSDAAPPIRRRSGARQMTRQPRHDNSNGPYVVGVTHCPEQFGDTAIFASRADAAPTSADAVATSISCTCPAWHDGRSILPADQQAPSPPPEAEQTAAGWPPATKSSARWIVRRSRTARGPGSADPTRSQRAHFGGTNTATAAGISPLDRPTTATATIRRF